jgi:hypothetical protein
VKSRVHLTAFPIKTAEAWLKATQGGGGSVQLQANANLGDAKITKTKVAQKK